MTYMVKEVFYTIQGEGAQVGKAAVFLRFSGCNLWSGREGERANGPGGCSRWCDTDFVGTDGAGGGRFSTPDQLARHASATWMGLGGSKLIVCTGGEPLLQLDEQLIEALHAEGFSVAIETNGTLPVPAGVDWVCVSPKAGSELVVRRGNELKLVVPQDGLNPSSFESMGFDHFFLQPMDSHRRTRSARMAVEYCLANPKWRLSVQIHKHIGCDDPNHRAVGIGVVG